MNALTKINSAAEPGKNPAELGAYPPTLPLEIALKTASPAELRAEYQLSDEEWRALLLNPTFLADVKAAADMVKKEGMSFKLKARLQAEELLKTSWRLIHAPGDEVPPSVKADLLKATMRWAGYDNKEQAGGNAVAGFNIQINLG